MNAVHCKRCRKVFQFSGSGIAVCPKCVKELEEKFVEVRDYIYDNPDARMDDVCEATGAEQNEIQYWLEEGRLMLTKASPIVLVCEVCNTPILTGKRCDSCRNELRSTLQSAANTMRPPPPPPKPTSKPIASKKEKMHLPQIIQKRLKDK